MASGPPPALTSFDRASARLILPEFCFKRLGGKAVAIGADVTREADVDAMLSLATKNFGRLDFLHNNAFGLPPAPENEQAVTRVADVPDSVWDKTIDVGLSAVFRTIKKAIPIMKAQGGGSIVNTASISGLYADYGIVAYNAAKAGIINLTRVVAVEYAADGIRCNCVCPGAIHTPLLEQSLVNPRIKEGFLRAIPLGRLGLPQEMANVVLFLGSDLASFVTGSAFVADGGQTAKTGSPSFIPD
jgi:meso-butanediol dehydrogenase/(S,S)-butanediol dehydrogenase/diacetyl reductase